MVIFNDYNTIDNIDQLVKDQTITFFKMIFDEMPTNDYMEELCIEIARHTPDAIKGNNKDQKNECRINPFVGALLIKKENNKYYVYGASRSALHNGEHGECGLLLNILGHEIVDDCEMYVTLEPCTQESRHEWTEPCSEIIKNRRIKNVHIGMLDPNPDVSGHGLLYLVNNGIEIELFNSKNQKIIRELNIEFSNQFGSDGDPRLNRKISRILDKYISNDAIKYFLKIASDELGINNTLDRTKDNKKLFYNVMIENRSIIDGHSSLLPFDVIDDFALFFFNKPYHKVDGATIRYYFDNGIDEEEHDIEEYNFDKPYAFAFTTYGKIVNNKIGDMGFIECIGKRYYGTTSETLEDLYKKGIQFIEDKFGNNGIEVVREAFINALMHRDYLHNHTFTKIGLKDNCIEIINPVVLDRNDIDEKRKSFENFTVPSYPINPKLMRYFQLINCCERNGSGMKSLKRSHRVKYTLDDDLILTTTLSFKPL